jgi:hypothetical protein
MKMPRWTIPLLLLLLSIAAYGLMIPSLGLYFDDWPVILLIQSKANFWDFYQYDRPFSAWTFVLTAPLFGTKPLNWHLFTLLLRWLTSLGMWWTLRQLWPHRAQQVTWMACLFAVHPVFTQQAIAVAYSQHFITYAFFFLSLGSMLAAFRISNRFWLFTGLALTSELVHLFTMEYFWGLELIRPVLIWLVFADTIYDRRKRWRATLKTWAPYLVLLLAALIWRGFFYHPVEDPNALRWLDQLLSSPLSALTKMAEMVLSDSLYLFLTTWYQTLGPGLIDLSSRFLLASWALVILVTVAMGIYLLKPVDPILPATADNGKTWRHQTITLGILIFLAGTFPVWITNKQITVGLYSNRFALSGMFGASIVLVGILDVLLATQTQKIIAISVLVGLAVGSHLRTANEYRWDWIQQQRFYWQLTWRAPAIQANTAFFSYDAISTYAGDYPISAALNTLYPRQVEYPEQNYWFFELDRGFHRNTKPYLNGKNVEGGLRNLTFSGNSLESLVIHYEPNEGACLQVLSPLDESNTQLPGLVLGAIPMSNIDRIGAKPANPEDFPPREVFGEEIKHTWCYYYQKAELARQFEDWDQIVALGLQVSNQSHTPNSAYEWTPFIEGYARSGDWERAKELTLASFDSDNQIQTHLCALWNHLSKISDGAAEMDNAITQVTDQLKCKNQ